MGLDESTAALSRRRRYVEGLLFRVVPAIAFAVVLVALSSAGLGLERRRIVPVLWLLGVQAAVNVPYWLAGRRAGFPLSHFYVHWTVDLAIITSIVYLLGGVDAPLMQFAYLMMILTAAIFVSQQAAFHLATGATLAYGLLAISEVAGWLPPRDGVWAHHFSDGIRIGIAVCSAVFFYMIAYSAGTLSELLRRANEELAGTKAVIEGHNRELEDRVRARTRALEAQTLQVQERNEELQELVRLVTHDLQNVAVASIETAHKLVERDGAQLSERGHRYADRLTRDCRLMTTMLRNLLEVVTETEGATQREVVDVGAVVRDAVSRAHTIIEQKNIAVTIGDLPPIWAEVQKIHHVFDNLVSNACKYVGDKPEPQIEITGWEQNGSVEYVVRDNGVGLEESQVSRIFQMYHRAPDQTVAGVVQQGHGIGLALVKRIVQRQGGRVWVESVQGEGSTFHVSFPREEEAVA